jgi:hypothetical protein
MTLDDLSHNTDCGCVRKTLDDSMDLSAMTDYGSFWNSATAISQARVLLL